MRNGTLLLEEKKMEQEINENEFEHYVFDRSDGTLPLENGTVAFVVAVQEKVTKYYRVYGVKTKQGVRQLYEESCMGEGIFDGKGSIEKDGWADYDGARITSIEKHTFSPCGFFDKYLTPPNNAPESVTKYLDASTMFDVQPEGRTFRDNRTYRKYHQCKQLVKGKNNVVCDCCMRKINDGWYIIKPLKEASE
jgi:hypothetical protein